MHRKYHPAGSLILILILSSASADSLVERYGEAFRDLPEKLIFDCSEETGDEIEVFGMILRVPPEFKRSEPQARRFSWLVSMSNGLFTTAYSSFEALSGADIVSRLMEYPAISDPTQNSKGIRVVTAQPPSEDPHGTYEVILSKDVEFLILTSVVPIDWRSILACIE